MQRHNSGECPDNLKPHRWKPGQSGNPKGRPKSTKFFTEAYRTILSTELGPEILKGGDAIKRAVAKMVDGGSRIIDFVALAVVVKAMKGDTHAAREIADRVEGKPIQTTRLTGANDGPLQIENYNLDKLSAEDIEALIEIYNRAEEERDDDDFTDPEDGS